MVESIRSQSSFAVFKNDDGPGSFCGRQRGKVYNEFYIQEQDSN